MGGTQVAALLTHTDALGLDNVVRRVKQRLADAAERLNMSDLKLGQAAFSPEVRTADALLELALAPGRARDRALSQDGERYRETQTR